MAELTGLKEGTIVVGGAGDNAAAAIGTGVAEDGKAFTTIGTSGVVFAHTSSISIDKGQSSHLLCSSTDAWARYGCYTRRRTFAEMVHGTIFAVQKRIQRHLWMLMNIISWTRRQKPFR